MAACLQAFRDGDGSELDDAGALIHARFYARVDAFILSFGKK